MFFLVIWEQSAQAYCDEGCEVRKLLLSPSQSQAYLWKNRQISLENNVW